MSSSDTRPVRAIYDRLAADYDRRWRRYEDATLGAVLAAASFEGRERVLDVPCGTGELEARLLARWPGLRVVGADLSAGMLRQARSKATARAAGWVQAEVRRLPFPDAHFDALTCANSFHYFRSPAAALLELRRVLRPRGRLILVDWCDDYLACRLCGAWLRRTDPAFHQTYGMEACRALLDAAGFAVETARRFRVGWLWGLMRLVAGRP